MSLPSFRCLILSALLLCSCAARTDRSDGIPGGAVPFPGPQVPETVRMQGARAVAEYLSISFWTAFLDTSRVCADSDTLILGVSRDGFRKAFYEYAGVTDMLSRWPEDFPQEAVHIRSALASLVRAAEDSGDTVFFRAVAEGLSACFYDPNSPYRNEDIYGPLAALLSFSPMADTVTRGRYRYEAGLCALNPCGSTAADFRFSDRAGRMYSMHGVEADYTVLFFTNPGCEACRRIVDALTSFRTLSGDGLEELISSGKVAVVNIYIDSDIEEWMDYSLSYPSCWYNGYDPYGILRDNSLYAVRAIPSLYLLDSEKRVLFKDAVPEKVIAYLQSRIAS